MNLIVAIADAVVTELNAGGFTQAFTAARSYLPEYELKDMDTLRVTVVPRANQVTPADRASVSNDVQIDVAVQKRLPPPEDGEAAAIDGLMLLVQEIAGRFRGKRLANAGWIKTVNDPIYAPEHLRELRQFTSVLTFTFKGLS